MKPILDLPGIGPHFASKLAEMGISTIEQFVATPSTELIEIQGVGARRLEILLEAASRVVELPKGSPVAQETLVQDAESQISQDSHTSVKEVKAPTSPKNVPKTASKKKAVDGKDSKKVKAKNKSKDKGEVSKRKSKGKAAAAKKAAEKKAKKAEAKKAKSKKKNKKSRKSKKK
jgi:nucleotidyltransferase/DNA polymerase involved in DNA repair